MTSRIAILIEAWSIAGHKDVPGAKVDVDNYEAFLKSDFGGAWDDSEVITLHKPKADQVARCIIAAGMCDYAFVTFSGHGHHVRGRGYEESRICINDTEEIPVTKLDPRNQRCQIIADSCREITVLEEAEMRVKKYAMALSDAQQRSNPTGYTAASSLIGISVIRAPALYMYSCSIGEVAGESQIRGGYFSRGLIDTAEALAEHREAGVLVTDRAFAGAYTITKRKAAKQTPVHDGSRRRNYFPFGVLAY